MYNYQGTPMGDPYISPKKWVDNPEFMMDVFF